MQLKIDEANGNWDTEDFPFGILIADKSRGDVTHQVQSVFRRVVAPRSHARPWGTELRAHVFVEIYFGDSKSSIGLQIADICVYFISRHLAGKKDSEGFYNLIRDRLFQPKLYPAE